MNLARLAIGRPTFITAVVILSLAAGLISFIRLPVDLFPAINFPVVMVRTNYPGAGPEEVEKMITKPLEETLSTLQGLEEISSTSKDGFSTVVLKFTLETDIKEAEQLTRDRVAMAKRFMPQDIDDPVLRRFDPTDQPVLILALSADLPPGKLYDLADQQIKPSLEQIPGVGLVEILGGRKREIHVELDRDKLAASEISATRVTGAIGSTGQNVPAGRLAEGKGEVAFRTLGEYASIDEIGKTVVTFWGNEVPLVIHQLGRVNDTLEDEKSRTYVSGQPALTFMVFRQSGANTVKVTDTVLKKITHLEDDLRKKGGAALQTLRIAKVQDTAKGIRDNITDVKESISIGIILTILVVYFFLANFRSTLITALALPNSLIGAFILMGLMGFSVNIMTMMALSLSVGLLIDDAIVVRENIFRHLEMGKPAPTAALEGTNEVTLAVLATSATIIAVFGPIGFLQGVVGQFFREFGLTVVAIMVISTFDALTIAPMLSAYFAQIPSKERPRWWVRVIRHPVEGFGRWQDRLAVFYKHWLTVALNRPKATLLAGLGVFVGSLMLTPFIPKTFMPAQDLGQYQVTLDLPPGTSLEGSYQVAAKVDALIRSYPEIKDTILTVGSRDLQSNYAEIGVQLVDESQRHANTTDLKDRTEKDLKDFKEAEVTVKDMGGMGGGERQFNLNIVGENQAQVEQVARKAFDRLKNHPGLRGAEFSLKEGQPEFQAQIDIHKAQLLGVSSTIIGQELRNLIEGTVGGVFREGGNQYNIRVRLQPDQRNLETDYTKFLVPNMNQRMVRIADVTSPVKATASPAILRQNRGRYVRISADINNKVGMGAVMSDVDKLFTKDMPLPEGVSYALVGQAERFKELMVNMLIAMGLGMLFIYLVLSSLYESFVTPFTLMLVIPLAVSGAFMGLLVTQTSFDLFAMIGFILLMGIATKNSILLVDFAQQQVAKGHSRREALLIAGETRLRPILMTTFALIAGMLPLAIGMNEVSKFRTSMGVAVIGGLITSTVLTLVVVPAAYMYVDDFRHWSKAQMKALAGTAPLPPGMTPAHHMLWAWLKFLGEMVVRFIRQLPTETRPFLRKLPGRTAWAVKTAFHFMKTYLPLAMRLARQVLVAVVVWVWMTLRNLPGNLQRMIRFIQEERAADLALAGKTPGKMKRETESKPKRKLPSLRKPPKEK
ncbi:MAG: efflux RND transporter permease subunit [Deltaproteobacteria bacterium]|nr:efflux RND transporter permease subunit [Deltaproteobacteria bacterium]